MNRLDIFGQKDNRGVYHPSLLGSSIAPRGKAGDKITLDSPTGSVEITMGRNIGTKEHLTSFLILSTFMEGLDRVGKDAAKDVEGLKVMHDVPDNMGNPKLIYTYVDIKISDIARLLFKSERKGSRVKESLKALGDMSMYYKKKNPMVSVDIWQEFPVNHFTKPSFGTKGDKRGWATIGISNQLLQVVIPMVRGVRKDKILLHRGRASELALFCEFYQFGNNDDTSFPQQTYLIENVLTYMGLEKDYKVNKGRVIKMLLSWFDELTAEDKDFPQYYYDENKGYFYNKYLKGFAKKIEGKNND